MSPDPLRPDWDVIVFGDEVESVITAVSAARCGARTLLLRKSQGMLGGLSTRGGLSYMDITPDYKAPMFREFLDAAGVIRVALEPNRAHRVLESMLESAGVTVKSGVMPTWCRNREGRLSGVSLNDRETLTAGCYIDATPDADLAQLAGVPYLKGLGGVLGTDQDYLAISPVFRLAGIEKYDLIRFEAELRARPDIETLLARALPYHPPELRDEYINRPCFSPEDMDYLDILNPVIGIGYHLWRHGEVDSYPTATTWIDGGNISLLRDEDGQFSMGFNGMVSQWVTRNAEDEGESPLKMLIQLSHGGPTPRALKEEMAAFETYLKEAGGMPGVRLIVPQELYVRQTVTLLARKNMTAERAIRGGVSPEEAIGTFSYWLDLRGTLLWKIYPGEHLPKPVFNVGMNVAFPPDTLLDNLAFIGRAAGYSPIGQGAGRIVQHNAMLGEAVGIAAAMATAKGCRMTDIAPADVREVLSERNGAPIKIEGHPTWEEAEIQASTLLKADKACITRLRTAQGQPTILQYPATE